MTHPGWLPQREGERFVRPLRDYPGEVVRTECRHCPRAGRYRLERLVERYGPAAALDAVAAGCPRLADWRVAGPCGAHYPDLLAEARP